MLSLTLNVKVHVSPDNRSTISRKKTDHHFPARTALLQTRRSLCGDQLRGRRRAVQPRHAQLADIRNGIHAPHPENAEPAGRRALVRRKRRRPRPRQVTATARLRGFASASLFLNILNDLATAGPDETGPIGAPYYEMQPDGNAGSTRSYSSWRAITNVRSRSKTSAKR